jgi:dsDNA-specific endonuclease/ATPase MutS2
LQKRHVEIDESLQRFDHLEHKGHDVLLNTPKVGDLILDRCNLTVLIRNQGVEIVVEYQQPVDLLTGSAITADVGDDIVIERVDKVLRLLRRFICSRLLLERIVNIRILRRSGTGRERRQKT